MMDFSNKLFLTFDVDWAVDEVLEHTYAIIEKYGIKATFLITHDTPFLVKLRENEKIELGLHPNFTPLLFNAAKIDYTQIFDNLLKIEPNAVSYRSHALTQGSIISQYASAFMKYELNTFIPKSAGFNLKPFVNPYKTITIPHFFEDDFSFSEISSISSTKERQVFVAEHLNPVNSLKVFDFHPVHVFLNTDNAQRYLDAKPYYKDFAELSAYVNKAKFGTMDVLIELIEQGKQKGFEFLNIRDCAVGSG